jgi:hypothetical protein
VGTPAASDVALAPGAGHGAEGDASLQGPAQEIIETIPAQPKPTKEPTNKLNKAGDVAKPEASIAAGAVIDLKSRMRKPKAADVSAVAADAGALATAHPKPEKRKNAKERAKAKYAKPAPEDGTTPMTAKAKSTVSDKASDRAHDRAEKAKVKAQKADTKARKISAAKAAKAARAA